MCGFVGYCDLKASGAGAMRDILQCMSHTIAHRGPDDEGIWMDPDLGFGFAHRRLAVIDLSPNGYQPMKSSSGRYVIAYNGEIYNFREIRKHLHLAGVRFRGDSDTEVVLAAIEHWDIDKALKQFRGMFSFALWDTGNKTLYLARDRMGEKPLYYGQIGHTFFFGSQVNAFLSHPKWSGTIDQHALSMYVQFNHIPAPFSIYQGIRKVQPGKWLEITIKNERYTIKEKCYWKLSVVANQDRVEENLDPNQEIEQLDSLIHHSVQEQMIADVPLGAFLSGGVDSSLIVAHLQKCSHKPVNTFTVGFRQEGYDEAPFAKKVANLLGTNHTEIYLSPEDVLTVVDKIPFMYDEPFSDPSQLPTYLISHLARQDVTVCLSGDGGDELFGGYSRYQAAIRSWHYLNLIPVQIRTMLAKVIPFLPNALINVTLKKIAHWFVKYGQSGSAADKIKKSAEILAVGDEKKFYQLLMSINKDPTDIVINGQFSPDYLWQDAQCDGMSYFESMMLVDQLHYLPGDILTKVDRAAMFNSLETRIPFLDPRIVEYSWSIPETLKFRNNESKWLLKQVLYKYLPRDLVDRPKSGFSVPIDTWLKGPLREWSESLLEQKKICDEDLFHYLPIRKKWEEHISGKRNWQHFLWNILMFQAWSVNQTKR